MNLYSFIILAFQIFLIYCLPEVSISEKNSFETSLSDIIGSYPNDDKKSIFVIADASGQIELYEKDGSYKKISSEETSVEEMRINLSDDYTIFGLQPEKKMISSYSVSNGQLKNLQNFELEEIPGCFHLLTTTKVIVALSNGEIITIDWLSQTSKTIARDQFSDFDECFFRGLNSEEILLMHETTVSLVSVKNNEIKHLVENIYFSDVTTFGWLSTFALYDYNSRKLKVFNTEGKLVEESGDVSSNLGKDSILRRWSFNNDKGENSFLIISSSKNDPTIYVYYYYEIEELLSYKIQNFGDVTFLLPFNRGIGNLLQETEIHVGLSSGEFYVLKFAEDQIIKSDDDDDDDSSSTLAWWAYVLIGIGLLILGILQFKFGKKCRSGRRRSNYNDSYGGGSGGFDGGDCGGDGGGDGGDGGGGD